jgi:opacity protein-like surface antigen
MKRLPTVALVLVAFALAARAADAAGPLHRYALVVGANSGGADRPQLQYAISDAERFARVMVDIGGVLPANEIILRQPKLKELVEALDTLTRRVTEAKGAAGGGRTEVLLYYSGHADEKGLLLGDDRYSYRTLRDRLDLIPADVRIAVLDACSSGAFTRVKGGKARPPFLVDESADMRGHAFLTSSSETEAAQESDRIHASYFTHYLVSGFRGAADTSGDGKVTLNEAYQFAFNETLGRTVDTKGGAQHPSYDINMSGTGDVVMTDVRQTTATLVLGEELEGRFFVRTAAQELVVELYKPRGRKVELAIEPGEYEVRVERDKGSFVTKTAVADGSRVLVDPRTFGAAGAPELTRRRGDEAGRFAVAGRNRLEMRVGSWSKGNNGATVTDGIIGLDAFGGFGYTRYVREDLAVTISVDSFGVDSGSSVGPNGVGAGIVGGWAVPIGIRWNPLKGDHRRQSLKPFLALGVGPVVGSSQGSFVGKTISNGIVARTTVGGQFGGGFDVHVARAMSLGVTLVYNRMANFSEPVGLRDNYNGTQVAIGIGWLFGKGQ